MLERERLLAMGGVIGMVHIQHNDRGWRSVTIDESLQKSLGHAVKITGVDRILHTRERWRTGQGVAAKGDPNHWTECHHQNRPAHLGQKREENEAVVV